MHLGTAKKGRRRGKDRELVRQELPHRNETGRIDATQQPPLESNGGRPSCPFVRTRSPPLNSPKLSQFSFDIKCD